MKYLITSLFGFACLAACSSADEKYGVAYGGSTYGGDGYGSTYKTAASVSDCRVTKSGVGPAPIDTVVCTCTQTVQSCDDDECGDCKDPRIESCASPSWLTIGLPFIPTGCWAGDWEDCEAACAGACESGCITD